MPLPASREPPEALTGLVKIGIAILRELFKGRASRRVEDGSVAGLSDSFATTTLYQ